MYHSNNVDNFDGNYPHKFPYFNSFTEMTILDKNLSSSNL